MRTRSTPRVRSTVVALLVAAIAGAGLSAAPALADRPQPVIDLDYLEDSAAETDANFVMTGSGGIVEIQGTAEGTPFSQDEFLSLLGLAQNGIAELVALQKQAIG